MLRMVKDGKEWQVIITNAKRWLRVTRMVKNDNGWFRMVNDG